MLKYVRNGYILSLLLTLFNDIIKYGLKLENFNVSVITPIPKQKKVSRDPSDYRPISVSSIFCTVYEKLIYLKTNSLYKFNIMQFGYKKATSCKHASFIVKETLN